MLAQSQPIKMLIGLVFLFSVGTYAQVHSYESKDNILASVLLNELVNRLNDDMQVGYYDVDNEAELPGKDNVDLVSRSEYARLCDGSSSDCMLQDSNPHPSLRDQEFLQHSSLWGHQFVTGGMGEGHSQYNTIVKTDASLPAYCNPPNPCPEGYDMKLMGGNCIANFENTAIFSREFQSAQDCTCDSEHMFDCAGQESADAGPDKDELAVEQFLRQFGHENIVNTGANSVVKKAGFVQDPRMEAMLNPFLQGDRLPIAAKKGNLLFH